MQVIPVDTMETKVGTIKRTLAECPIFSSLNDAELEKVAGLAVEREFADRARVFQEGDKGEEIFVLEDGKVVLQMSLAGSNAPASKRVTVDFAAKSEMFGGSAVVEPYVYSLTAVCLQKSRAVAINGAKLRALLKDNYHIGYVVLSELIKVVISRLADTRQMLLSERSLPARMG